MHTARTHLAQIGSAAHLADGRIAGKPRWSLRSDTGHLADRIPEFRCVRLAGMSSPTPPASVRPATAADLPSIRHIVAAAYDVYLSRMDKPPAPMLREYGAAVDAGIMWVTGTPVAGLISITRVDDDIMLIENVAVHPDQQGTGLGRRLMEFAEQQARERGITRLALYTNEVMTENQAIYHHLGYRVTSRGTEDGYRRVFMEKVLPAS